jgi:tRNA-specific 2-thiouridylase
LDSSVAAALLKRADFYPEPGRRVDVIGVFMRLYPSSSRDSEKRARKVAKILGIPFYVLNFEKEFKKKIIDYFLDGYRKGITPNPCVICNKEIKFGLLLKKALALNADFIATGHYARKNETTTQSSKPIYRLLQGKDKEKDQSYFLWTLSQNQLKRVLFPIGDYTREEVKKLARKFKLPVLKARKSVEICFIQTTVNDFLKKYLKDKPGKIIDVAGNIIGKHQGLSFYTIGQRKGIGLSGGPYYVLDKDLKKNLLIVTKGDEASASSSPFAGARVNEKDLYKKELICEKINWIFGKEPKLPLKVKAKIRYRHQLASATIYKLSTTHYKLTFDRPQRAITPGQSVVFFKGQEVLGGGIIT